MSTARIEVSKDTSDIPLLLQMGQQGGYDPYFIETEFQKIKSTKVLEKVIENLNLNQVWGKRYGIDNLKTAETYEILKRQIDLRQSRNTSLIEINAYSENKEEAANLANEIASVYQLSRKASKMGQSEAGIEALKKEMEIQTEKVDMVQKQVDKMRQDLKIADVGDSQFQMTLEPETVRNIERDRIRADEEYTQLNTLYGKLKELNRADLRKAIPTAFRDEAMDRYLADLAKSEQQYAIASVDCGPENPEVHRLT
ncbi:MAG: ywqD 2, partial [Verrucomicrobiales bacterium]|nr:ywqD 2 [Verrucomicrobiales bacterium]